MNAHDVGTALGIAMLAALAVGAVRLVALRAGIMDHPTERSSHHVATPRGGGLGIVVVVLAVAMPQVLHAGATRIMLAMCAMTLVALTGWLDDRRGLGVRARLYIHLMAGLSVGFLSIANAGTGLLTVLLLLWWTFWTVSSINLVNFMDGINGLVAMEVAIFAASLAWFGDQASVARELALYVAAACAGFLPWNFPRARIFLGDSGSGALGFLVPLLALLSMRDAHIDIVRAHLPLVPLYVDATVTILVRLRRRERITAPHRSHLYQRLANGPLGHTSVTLLYAAVSLCGVIIAHGSSFGYEPALVTAYLLGVGFLGAMLNRHASTGSGGVLDISTRRR